MMYFKASFLLAVMPYLLASAAPIQAEGKAMVMVRIIQEISDSTDHHEARYRY